VRILITGGAGFVGSTLATLFKTTYPTAQIICFDNLKRRGSELNLTKFRDLGISFVHGDVRNHRDLEDLDGNFDVLIEASAEPSVHAGVSGSPNYVIETNLIGTLNCLEFARKRVDRSIFMSTSRVYSLAPLRAIHLQEAPTRLVLDPTVPQSVGVTRRGINEEFPTNTARSLYGATKLSSEQIAQEYAHTYGLKIVIDRCGVIAGRGQFGKVDQGVFTMWVAHHYFGQPLKYIGYNGHGKQVRDLLHPQDLFRLFEKQLEKAAAVSGVVYNVGGGQQASTSLCELTTLAQEATGRQTSIGFVKETPAMDVPYYVTDNSKVELEFEWRPECTVKSIVDDIAGWIAANESTVRPIFGGS
jgi:CDP-paratose 2-epimerase